MSYPCDNCGTHVSDKYYRVFAIDGRLECCPECTDMVRRNGKARLKQREQERES